MKSLQIFILFTNWILLTESVFEQPFALSRNAAARENAWFGGYPDPKRPFCQRWYNGRPIDCSRKGLVRVHQAFEDENCAAALQSVKNGRMVGEKIRKLKDESPFVFLRGTAALFYYDMACEDPTFRAIQSNPHLFVISNGDCHPENFGTLLMANGNMSFSVNDFDQAFRAPFTWDLKRGAVAFILACLDKDFPKGVCRETVDQWIQGYRDVVSGNCTFTNHDRLVEGAHFMNRKEARAVKQVMEAVRTRFDPTSGYRKWLAKHVDMTRLRFLPRPDVIPLDQDKVPDFQAVIDQYLYSGVMALVDHPKDGPFWKVLDVARKTGTGTGSLGLDRYRILIGGADNAPCILDMKQVSAGVMAKYLHTFLTDYNQMFRVMSMIKTQRFHNLYFGVAEYGGRYFSIRQQSPIKSSVVVADLDERGFVGYAYVTGRAQAMLHISVGCKTPECPLGETAQVDVQACREVAGEFEREADLQASIARVAFDSAARHRQYHHLLAEAFRTCPALERHPVLFLSHHVTKCEELSRTGL